MSNATIIFSYLNLLLLNLQVFDMLRITNIFRIRVRNPFFKDRKETVEVTISFNICYNV